MAVDLDVYRMTEQGPAVPVIVFDVVTSIKQCAKPHEVPKFDSVVRLGPIHSREA